MSEAHKLVIGVVGGIGSGKSTVAEQFGRLGCAVISADKLNHEVLARRDVVAKLRDWWGDQVLDNQGNINRQVLGSIVFNDSEALKRLTDLTHPLIAQRQSELIGTYQNDCGVKAIVLDVPLLYEVGQAGLCDVVVFVDSRPSLRAERVEKRLGWEKKRLKKAENFQISLDKKAEMSDYTLYNNSGIPELADQVTKLLSQLLSGNAS